ncbi:hypothetical protein LW977_11290 [Erwinia amylovora]|uniref:Uncharacterized protein n=3 Tax=Erwinia amylovora TaxID=552 RepID=A0A831A3T9_ERWAM|nr:hypothetical protein [Erwinia amylovora]EKV52530.1 hypothetical protein EaACW_3118 [Erwinia amylovora ACW56400]CBA23000.1 hypothetical protein predicted by Glimmer/Critica [Erwinia amylovora CFBP1430]CCP00429.1 hypothetical protein BN438_3168 [Erwinia amylovora UPN527]ATZ10452.1 hypothetical protein AD997_02710 [Erwinia amylovora]MBZ2390819.1 hypothetical protein [Erwinia amylovora]
MSTLSPSNGRFLSVQPCQIVTCKTNEMHLSGGVDLTGLGDVKRLGVWVNALPLQLRGSSASALLAGGMTHRCCASP